MRYILPGGQSDVALSSQRWLFSTTSGLIDENVGFGENKGGGA
jgi:hypothetical protein